MNQNYNYITALINLHDKAKQVKVIDAKLSKYFKMHSQEDQDNFINPSLIMN